MPIKMQSPCIIEMCFGQCIHMWQLVHVHVNGTSDPVAAQVTWREEAGDSWLRYLRSYVAGVKHLYRNEAPTIYDTQDYRPYTKQ